MTTTSAVAMRKCVITSLLVSRDIHTQHTPWQQHDTWYNRPAVASTGGFRSRYSYAHSYVHISSQLAAWIIRDESGVSGYERPDWDLTRPAPFSLHTPSCLSSIYPFKVEEPRFLCDSIRPSFRTVHLDTRHSNGVAKNKIRAKIKSPRRTSEAGQ
jgi:hypothetical protein